MMINQINAKRLLLLVYQAYRHDLIDGVAKLLNLIDKRPIWPTESLGIF